MSIFPWVQELVLVHEYKFMEYFASTSKFSQVEKEVLKYKHEYKDYNTVLIVAMEYQSMMLKEPERVV